MILDGNQPQSIEQAVAALRQADLVGLPTETVYGLAADAMCSEAVAKIFQRKGRPADHPLIVHVAGAAQTTHFVDGVSATVQQLMEAFWPGPLTLIVPRKSGVADMAAGGHPSIGLRCPSHPVAQKLLTACFAAPSPIYGLAAPSANRFGKISPTSAQHVEEEFGASLLVLDGGDCSVGIESTILDCTRDVPVILRPGILGADEIRRKTGLDVHDPFVLDGANSDFLLAEDGHADPAAPGTLAAHYAPNAKVRIMDAQNIQAGLQILGAQAKNIAIYARTKLTSASPNLIFQQMPHNPADAAHELFRTLRELDDKGVKLIWIEELPASPDWNGVRDRLQRAAASA